MQRLSQAARCCLLHRLNVLDWFERETQFSGFSKVSKNFTLSGNVGRCIRLREKKCSQTGNNRLKGTMVPFDL
jgi:hypothetical protein